MSKDAKGIEKLNANEENKLELGRKLEELKNRIAISDRNTEES